MSINSTKIPKIGEIFSNAKTASMVCEKEELSNKFDCQLYFGNGVRLSKYIHIDHREKLCDKEMHDFIKSLGAVDTSEYDKKHINDTKRWIFKEKSRVKIYSFDNSKEIHFVINDILE